ncbi:hypothetical protein, partial [Phytopseudomonas punonensis]|uniref:hypothetical protein n=1 Tax=Phytopseudomonas punonensis TaxID=1220495 RepID=UPI001ABF32D3
STHTNCLIQLLKNGWLILSSQPRRASYSSLISCQVVFEELFLSSQHLAAPDQIIFSPAGGAFYSVTNRCQHPLLPPSITPDRTINRTTQTTLSMPAHSTRIRRPRNLYFRLTR